MNKVVKVFVFLMVVSIPAMFGMEAPTQESAHANQFLGQLPPFAPSFAHDLEQTPLSVDYLKGRILKRIAELHHHPVLTVPDSHINVFTLTELASITEELQTLQGLAHVLPTLVDDLERKTKELSPHYAQQVIKNTQAWVDEFAPQAAQEKEQPAPPSKSFITKKKIVLMITLAALIAAGYNAETIVAALSSNTSSLLNKGILLLTAGKALMNCTTDYLAHKVAMIHTFIKFPHGIQVPFKDPVFNAAQQLVDLYSRIAPPCQPMNLINGTQAVAAHAAANGVCPAIQQVPAQAPGIISNLLGKFGF